MNKTYQCYLFTLIFAFTALVVQGGHPPGHSELFVIDTRFFELTLEAEPGESGSIAGAGSYLQHKEVQLKATPAGANLFGNWTDEDGNLIDNNASFSFPMPAEHVSLNANFLFFYPDLPAVSGPFVCDTRFYDLEVMAIPENAASVFGCGTYLEHKTITVGTVPNNENDLLNWTNTMGKEVSRSASFDFTMPPENTLLKANYEGHNITFQVQDEAGNDLPGVLIILNDTYYRHGNYVFENMKPNQYAYTALANNYHPAEGHVTLASVDVSETITLTAKPSEELLFIDLDIFQPNVEDCFDDFIPGNLPLSGVVTDGETECFDALQTITVSDFTVEAGGSAELIAGQSIHLLPGTTVEHGGYLLARIAALEDDYCGIPKATEIAKEPETSKEEDVVSADFPFEIRENGFFKLYPNPTCGTFTLELTTAELEQSITVEAHSVLGGRIFAKELPAQRMHTLSLEGQQPGMYIIRVMKGGKVGVERLIKR